MKRMGICQKCGKEKIVRDHHLNGYGKGYEDEVAPYCQSCDMKAHNKAKREGGCKLTHVEVKRIGHNSYGRRCSKKMMLPSAVLEPNIQLFEQIIVNINTEHINICSYFSGRNGKKLKRINEAKAILEE